MVFFGTPGIAVPVLEALVGSSHEVLAVVSAPDRPRGRGLELQSPEVKKAAVKAGLPVMQPAGLRSAQVQAGLEELGADLFVVAAYGLILPPAVLDIPPLGCINVHFSLLPALRGAAPVQWAIAEGHEKTGVSIMMMDPGLDTGPVLETVAHPIRPDDTSATLSQALALVGAEALVDVVSRLTSIEPVPQPEVGATYAAKVTPKDARIDWSRPAHELRNRIRAFNPRPGAWSVLQNRRLKILEAAVINEESGHEPGTLLVGAGGVPVVQTGSKLLELTVVQPEGKTAMDGSAFVRGRRIGFTERFSVNE
ncbi:MAG: methionyl-tRNA formyltransferase [Actinomycetota bacterium]